MEPLSLRERAAFYHQEFPQFPDSWPQATSRWLTAHWILGNNYRNRTKLYGAYPPSYLPRVLSLFPDARRGLHLFSGSLRMPQGGPCRWVGLDLVVDDCRQPSVCGSAMALPFRAGSFDLVIADPPYSPTDAVQYQTPMPDRRLVMREVWSVVEPGGMVAWLDCVLPQFRKTMWKWVGVLTIVRSTNHRIRGSFLFERLP